MALFSRLPNGGGLSKNKTLTSFDLKTISHFGDIISQRARTESYYACGGIYYEKNGNGTYTLYVYCVQNNVGYVYIYNISNGNVTKTKEISIISNVNTTYGFQLNSDKNSNIVVLSQINGTPSTLYYITKDTFELKTLSVGSYRGATVINGTIYCSMWCDLNSPFLNAYSENGTHIKVYNNNISALLH